MIIKSIQAVSLTALLTFAGCQSEEIMQKNDQTAFIVSLTDELSVTTKGTPTTPTTEELKEYTLTITDVSDASKKYTHSMVDGSLVTVDPGTYKIQAENEDKGLAFNAPYYKGIVEYVEISKGEQKSVEIECSMANAMATVEFVNQSAFDYAFKEYWIEVSSSNSADILKWENFEDYIPYFSAGSNMSFVFKGKTQKGNEKSFNILVGQSGDDKWTGEAAAKTKYKLSLQIKEVTSINISIDAIVTPEETTIGIPLEWLPTITANVQDENIWTKEFTIDELTIEGANLDPTKIKYQWSIKGTNEWSECSNTNKHVFTKGQPARDLQARIVYNLGDYELESNVVDFELEEEAQLENSDMEDWYYETVARTILTYYPWSKGATSFWNTNNSYTTRYKSTTALYTGSYPYNCFPAVSYVVGGHSNNKAAEIRSTASGQYNALSNTVQTYNKVAGELFVGDINVSTYSYTIDTNGKSFNSRPTAIKFWFKYKPVNIDTWRAYIKLMDEEYNIIVESEIERTGEVDDWQEVSMPLDYEDKAVYNKCRHIYIVFSSTTTTGDSMQYNSYSSYTLWKDNTTVTLNESKCWVGSVLTIDDISLVYDK